MKQMSDGLGQALLCQAVIAKAMIDNIDDFATSRIYNELYEPLISVYNDLHPNAPVSNPMTTTRLPEAVDMQYVRENAGMYFMSLCSIVSDYGVKLSIPEAFIIAKRNKWFTSNKGIDRPRDLLEHFTGVKWKKEVYETRNGRIDIAPGSYAVYKRFAGKAGGTIYKRIYGSTFCDMKYKAWVIVFTPAMKPTQSEEAKNEESIGGI